MGKKEQHALLSQLQRLMLHIIKWFSQKEKRSKSWINSIEDARDKIDDIQRDRPSLNRNFIRKCWDTVFNKAKRGAEAEMGKKTDITHLTEKQVFEEDYKLKNNNKKKK